MGKALQSLQECMAPRCRLCKMADRPFLQTQETPMATAPENCRINYVELNVRDIASAKAFYGRAFGWTFTDYGPEYTEFSDGAMKGGFTTQAPPSPAGGPLVILYADKLEAA